MDCELLSWRRRIGDYFEVAYQCVNASLHAAEGSLSFKLRLRNHLDRIAGRKDLDQFGADRASHGDARAAFGRRNLDLLIGLDAVVLLKSVREQLRHVALGTNIDDRDVGRFVCLYEKPDVLANRISQILAIDRPVNAQRSGLWLARLGSGGLFNREVTTVLSECHARGGERESKRCKMIEAHDDLLDRFNRFGLRFHDSDAMSRSVVMVQHAHDDTARSPVSAF